MRLPKTQIYMIPFMGLSVDIFEGLVLTNKEFKQWYLPWFTPLEGETIQEYASRMLNKIKHPTERCVILGAGFGGVMAQEMAKQAKFKKVVILASYKSVHELSAQMKRIVVARQYDLIAEKLIADEDLRTEFSLGKTGLKLKQRFARYMFNFDKIYFKWAVNQLLSWQQSEPMEGILHIHGAQDGVLPLKNINNCIVVPEGTHALVPLKSSWLNEHLLNLINGNPLQYDYEKQ